MSTTFPAPIRTTPAHPTLRPAYVAWAALVPALVLVALVLGAVAVPATGLASFAAATGALAALAGVAVLDGRARSRSAVTDSRVPEPVAPADAPEPADPRNLRLRELSVATDDAVQRAMAAGQVGLARELFIRSLDEADVLLDGGRGTDRV